MHKLGQFYTRKLLAKRVRHCYQNFGLKRYKLSMVEVRNVNHRDRPCQHEDDYDDYVLKVQECSAVET